MLRGRKAVLLWRFFACRLACSEPECTRGSSSRWPSARLEAAALVSHMHNKCKGMRAESIPSSSLIFSYAPGTTHPASPRTTRTFPVRLSRKRTNCRAFSEIAVFTPSSASWDPRKTYRGRKRGQRLEGRKGPGKTMKGGSEEGTPKDNQTCLGPCSTRFSPVKVLVTIRYSSSPRGIAFLVVEELRGATHLRQGPLKTLVVVRDFTRICSSSCAATNPNMRIIKEFPAPICIFVQAVVLSCVVDGLFRNPVTAKMSSNSFQLRRFAVHGYQY
eukprot:2520795-Rhodomonas_salina.2